MTSLFCASCDTDLQQQISCRSLNSRIAGRTSSHWDAFEAVCRASLRVDDRWKGRAGASRDRKSTLEMTGAKQGEEGALETRHLTISCFQPASEGRVGARRAKGFLKDWLEPESGDFICAISVPSELGSALARWGFESEIMLSSIGAGHVLDERPASTASPTGRADLGASPGQAQICQHLTSVAMRLHP